MKAISLNIAHCNSCGLAVKIPGGSTSAFCPRCDQPLSFRKLNSVLITSILLLLSSVLLIPANLYPIMTVVNFGHSHTGTITSGVVQLINGGMYGVAFLVFFASLVVPVFKIIGLATLCLAVYFKWQLNYRQATTIYRLIVFIGRWSMLDLFMISILTTLVNFGIIATVVAGPGATAFSCVVVLTIFASHSFDPRLMWDLTPETEISKS